MMAKEKEKIREYKIDATDKKLGRMASKVALLLMGKDSPDYERNKVAPVKVNVSNASKLDIDSKKMEEKTYIKYSGYPGGKKEKTMREVILHKGYSEVLRRAVYGMLPANKLRKRIMKNLEISE